MDVRFPIGTLQVPENVSLEDVASWLGDIETYPARLRQTVESLNDEQLNKKYRDGSWNVRQLVHHIADSQLNMYQRLKIALTDGHPTAPNFEQDEWAKLPDNDLPVDSSLKMMEGINERVVAIGKHLTVQELDRIFIHSKNGPITVGAKMAKLRWHAEHHLAHIKIALEK